MSLGVAVLYTCLDLGQKEGSDDFFGIGDLLGGDGVPGVLPSLSGLRGADGQDSVAWHQAAVL